MKYFQSHLVQIDDGVWRHSVSNDRFHRSSFQEADSR